MQFSKINESNETALLNQNPPHFKTVRKVIFLFSVQKGFDRCLDQSHNKSVAFFKIWPLFISSLHSSPKQRGMSRIMVLPASQSSLAGKLKSSEKEAFYNFFMGTITPDIRKFLLLHLNPFFVVCLSLQQNIEEVADEVSSQNKPIFPD